MSIITKGELISEAKVKVRELNADSRMSNRFIWSIIDKHMTWLIRRESDKLKLVKYDYLFQTAKCVKVEEAPAVDPCCGIKTKCTVFRTVDKLPEMFEDSTGIIVKAVFSIDGTSEFTHITIQDYMRKVEDPNSRFDNSKYYFFNNGYLYFPKHFPRKVHVKAMFRDLVTNYCDCDNKPTCVNQLNQPSSIPPHIRGELMDYVTKDLGVYKQVRPDVQVDKDENRIGTP